MSKPAKKSNTTRCICCGATGQPKPRSRWLPDRDNPNMLRSRYGFDCENCGFIEVATPCHWGSAPGA